MKNLTLTTTSGEPLEIQGVEDTVAQEALLALTQQLPAVSFLKDENTAVHVNMRQVVSLTVEVMPEEEPEDTRTVAQLKEALDGAKVEYQSGALKAELLELAKQNNI